MALFVRNTNYRSRVPHHNVKALMETVAKRPGSLLDAMYSRVKSLHTKDNLALA
jgi:hypothetical protein